jgi:hypothetical protein
MNSRYYHTPPAPDSNRVRCPVCHQEVYSRAGIHPQCAVRQSDPPKPKNNAKVSPSQVELVVEIISDQEESATVPVPDKLGV